MSAGNGPALRVRRLVPLVGAGFNRWLLGDADVHPGLSSWDALLRHIAWTEGALPDAHLEAQLATRTKDASFVWEAILLRVAERRREQVSDVEARIASNLHTLFSESEARALKDDRVLARAKEFFAALTLGGKKRADVLTLNTDGILKALAEKLKVPVGVLPVHGSLSNKHDIAFGVQRYGRKLADVIKAFDNFKASDSKRPKATNIDTANAHRDLDRSVEAHWLEAAINAPLLLLGASLSRLEIDVWHFLHLRARNHTPVEAVSRPGIFRLTSGEDSGLRAEHWLSLHESIAIQPLDLGATWNEAWPAVLGLLSDERALMPRK